jgi:outer membrane protein assembly factor BamB
MPKRCFALMLWLAIWLASGCSTAPEPPLRQNFSLKWQIQTEGAINQPPLIVGKVVILVPSGAPLLALDLETGATRWRFSPPEGVWERAYASDGERVFVGVKGGRLAALEVSTGKLLWQKDLGINVQVPPLVSENVLYVPTTFVGPELRSEVQGKAKIFALETKTGAEIWAFESENYILQTPARNRTTLFLGGSFYDPAPVDEGGHVRIYALDLETGSPRWTSESEDGFFKRLYATENTLIFIGYQDFVSGIDASSGELLWRFDTGNWTPSLLGADETVYFGSANTKVFALNAASGEIRWQFDIPEGTFNYLLGAPILQDDRLYFLTQHGDFFALQADTGKMLWQAATRTGTVRNNPAISNGWLVIGDIDGKVYGYR